MTGSHNAGRIEVTLSTAQCAVLETALNSKRVAVHFSGGLREFLLTAALVAPYAPTPTLEDVRAPEGAVSQTFWLEPYEHEAIRAVARVQAFDSVAELIRGCAFTFVEELQLLSRTRR